MRLARQILANPLGMRLLTLDFMQTYKVSDSHYGTIGSRGVLRMIHSQAQLGAGCYMRLETLL